MFREFWYRNFEFDRAGEKLIHRSLRIWHRGGRLNHFLAKCLWNRMRRRYHCNIFPGITAGEGLRIEHCMGISIGKTAVLGSRCRLYQNAEIVSRVAGDEDRNRMGQRRHAVVGDDCTLCAGCCIIGPVRIGSRVMIGARAIVTRDVPDDSVVTGVNDIRPRDRGQKPPEYKL